MKTLKYILVALLFSGCQMESDLQTGESPILRTKVSDLQFAQSDKVDLASIGVVGVSKIVKKDKLYVLLTSKGNYRFAIYNSETGAVKRLVPAGKNEGEGLYYLGLTLNGNTVSALDFGTGRFVEIDLNEYATPGYQPIFTSLKAGDKLPTAAIRVNNQVISTGLYTKGRYCCTSQSTGSDSYSVSYPACADPTLTDTLKGVLFASNYLAVNPSLTRLACANVENGCLDICEINGNELRRIDEIHMTTPRVEFNREKPRGRKIVHPVLYKKDNALGFCDLTVSDQYIFALYSGRTYKQHKLDLCKGRTIVVFDWNGAHVRTYQLRQDCSSISYDASTNTIYALSYNKGKREIIPLTLD